jgi:uncharacterized protein with PIN domain
MDTENVVAWALHLDIRRNFRALVRDAPLPTTLAKSFDCALRLFQSSQAPPERPSLTHALGVLLRALPLHAHACGSVSAVDSADGAWESLARLLEALSADPSHALLFIKLATEWAPRLAAGGARRARLLVLARVVVDGVLAAGEGPVEGGDAGGEGSAVGEEGEDAAGAPPPGARRAFLLRRVAAAKLACFLGLGPLPPEAAWPLLRAVAAAHAWGALGQAAALLFPPPLRDAALAWAAAAAEDKRQGRAVQQIEGLRALVQSSSSGGGGGGGGDSGGTEGLPGRAAVALFSEGGEGDAPLHPLAAHAEWRVGPFRFSKKGGGLVFDAAAARVGAGDAPASSLMAIVAQGHAPPADALRAALCAARPPTPVWLQRSLVHAVRTLRNVELATRLAAGDGGAQVFLCELLAAEGAAAAAMAAAAWFLRCAPPARGERGALLAARLTAIVAGGSAAPPPAPRAGGDATAAGAPRTWSAPLRLLAPAEPRCDDGGALPSDAAFWCPAPAALHYVADSAGLCALRGSVEAEAAAAEKDGRPLLLAVDSERRPGGGGPWPLSLLQLATPRSVWVVDLLALGAAQRAPGEVPPPVRAALTLPNVVLVGWGVAADLTQLAAAAPRLLAPLPLRAPACLELRELPPPAGAAPPRSLADAVRAWLGAPLDKRAQTSDWQARPLSWEQLEYATLDGLSAARIAEAAADCLGQEKLRSLWRAVNVAAEVSVCVATEGGDGGGGAPVAAEGGGGGGGEGGAAAALQLPGPLRLAAALCGAGLPADRLAHFCGPAPPPPSDVGGGPPPLPVNALATMVGGAPALVVVPSTARVDFFLLLAAAGAPRDAPARLATPAECGSLFGFLPGAFPPSRAALLCASVARVFLDCSLRENDGGGFACGGGSAQHALYLRSFAELEVLAGGGGALTMAPLRATAAAAAPAAALSPAASEEPVPPPAPPLPPPPATLPPPRLLCDSSLGRLVRWLRVIGVDTESRAGPGADAWAVAHRPRGTPPAPLSVPELLRWANESGRVLVTRDSKVLARRGGCAALWVAANDCTSQFQFVCDALAIRVKPSDLMARCSACNGEGYEVLSAEEVRARGGAAIPEKVLQVAPRFFACTTPACRKVYWEGSKYDAAQAKYDALFASNVL